MNKSLLSTRSWLWTVILCLSLLHTFPLGGVAAETTSNQPLAADVSLRSQRLTLLGAIELARRNYPSIKTANLRTDASREGITQAKTAYLPRVDILLDENYGTANNVTGFLAPQNIVPNISGAVSNENNFLGGFGPGSAIRIAELKERLRKKIAESMPDTAISFESGDIVSQVMNFGAPTPIEVATNGPSFAADKQFAAKVLLEMQKIPGLRDIQYSQPQDYPTIDVAVDRRRSGQLGVTVNQVGRSLLSATSSSRFVVPNYWADSKTGIGYQVQVEIPQSTMDSVEAVKRIPAMNNGNLHPLIADVAQVKYGTMPGEIDRYNMQRMLTITANVSGTDLGRAAREVRAAISRAGEAPRGVSVTVRGQIPPMQDAFAALLGGLAVAVLSIFLLLSANFQSMRLALIVLATVPAVISGVVLALFLTGTTLNVQSFIGAIMAIGVGVANTILLVTFSEQARLKGGSAAAAALEGATGRIRPILMTSTAMIAGMMPMALAVAEGGDQTAPLGRAVIGGLIASTIVVLTVIPSIFSLVQGKASRKSASVHPRGTAGETEGAHE